MVQKIIIHDINSIYGPIFSTFARQNNIGNQDVVDNGVQPWSRIFWNLIFSTGIESELIILWRGTILTKWLLSFTRLLAYCSVREALQIWTFTNRGESEFSSFTWEKLIIRRFKISTKFPTLWKCIILEKFPNFALSSHKWQTGEAS